MSHNNMLKDSLEVPVVTTDDLLDFHQKHFPSLPKAFPAKQVITAPSTSHNDIDADDLGHYSDGVKRTLTDEQIAMFRHSEIQTYLRERRLRRENADVEDPFNASEGVPKLSKPLGSDTDDKADAKRSASASESQASGKRKWQRFIDLSDTNPERLTHRRLAREMDEQKAKSIDLAYGDDDSSYASAIPVKRLKDPTPPSSDRKQVSCEDHEGFDVSSSEKQQPPPFIWPSLGTGPPT